MLERIYNMELIVGIGKFNSEFTTICTLSFWGTSGNGFFSSTYKVPNCIVSNLRIGYLCIFTFSDGVVSHCDVIDYEVDISKAIILLTEYMPMANTFSDVSYE